MIIVQADGEKYDLFEIEKVKQGQTDHKTATGAQRVSVSDHIFN